uniref:NADH-ubiquinone oxidoreductase chain 4 n=1 Tax=Ancoracysta twista TaxID=2044563 RepID=A0A2H4R8E0_9EUKA|nr:NADH dehydrogenase subunit 4 [Ancoracysta twista]ATY40915.1 NADH dehydrogenase subunit 4 [Ancoracysta twista]
MYESNLLLTIILMPLAGTALLLLIPDYRPETLRKIAFNTTAFTFLISNLLWVGFDNSVSKYQFVEKFNWMPFLNINYYIGIDGISLFFILLTTFLTLVCVLHSWTNIKHHFKEYLIAFLVLESLMISIFCVLDLLLFYIFFESVLIPMFLIIGVWGSRERKIRAAYFLFLYTLLGSLFMLLAILAIYFETGTTDLQILQTVEFSGHKQLLLWLAFFASFAVKVPMVPFHIWLPEAHVEAPTAGSVILAGILLKLGTYGFLRFSIPMFPDATIYFTPLIYTMSVIAVIYTSLTTLRQIDLKRIIAYSSVAHMGFVTIGMFTLNVQGIEGSILLMLSHGLVSGALFLCIGVLYDRHHTRMIKYYRGLVHAMPLYITLLAFFTLANISMPGTSSFVSEFLILIGIFKSNSSIAFLATTGMILGAAYSLWLFNRVAYGALDMLYICKYADVGRRESYMFVPFVLLILLMGIYADIFIDPMHVSVTNLIHKFHN